MFIMLLCNCFNTQIMHFNLPQSNWPTIKHLELFYAMVYVSSGSNYPKCRNYHWASTNTLNFKADIYYLTVWHLLNGLWTIIISIRQDRNPEFEFDSRLENERSKKIGNHSTSFQRIPIPHLNSGVKTTNVEKNKMLKV